MVRLCPPLVSWQGQWVRGAGHDIYFDIFIIFLDRSIYFCRAVCLLLLQHMFPLGLIPRLSLFIGMWKQELFQFFLNNPGRVAEWQETTGRGGDCGKPKTACPV